MKVYTILLIDYAALFWRSQWFLKQIFDLWPESVAKMLIYAKGKWRQKSQIKLMHLSGARARARTSSAGAGAGISLHSH